MKKYRIVDEDRFFAGVVLTALLIILMAMGTIDARMECQISKLHYSTYDATNFVGQTVPER